MTDLDKLRERLTDEQRSILNTIWRYEREKKQGIPAITLYDRFDSEEDVRAALQELGGDVAYIPKHDADKRRYHLTFLGYLLAERGEELENLLTQYMEYVRQQLKADGEVHEINWDEAMEASGFTEEEKSFFKEMFYRTPFHGSGGGGKSGLPSNVDEWYFAKEMRKYVQYRATRNYDPKTPVDGGKSMYIRVAYPEGYAAAPYEVTIPPEISESIELFREDHPDLNKVAFVMMRFGKTEAHKNIVAGIKVALNLAGITAVRADEKQYHDDLFPNILTYLYGCGFGIAVFERLEEEAFNPNVSLEVGYMFALRKPVCLLKDRTLKTLHTDLVGRLYRVFDPQEPVSTISIELASWLKDKGIVQ